MNNRAPVTDKSLASRLDLPDIFRYSRPDKGNFVYPAEPDRFTYEGFILEIINILIRSGVLKEEETEMFQHAFTRLKESIQLILENGGVILNDYSDSNPHYVAFTQEFNLDVANNLKFPRGTAENISAIATLTEAFPAAPSFPISVVITTAIDLSSPLNTYMASDLNGNSLRKILAAVVTKFYKDTQLTQYPCLPDPANFVVPQLLKEFF